jgi:hypothetical protein
MTRRPILGCQFVYVAVLVDGFMSRRRRCQEILADIGGVAILVRALWKRWRMFRRLLGRAELVSGGVAAVSPVVTSVAWRNNCGCLDDLFFICTGVATLWVIAGSIVLAQARSAEVRVWSRSSSGTSRICHELTLAGVRVCHLNSVLSRLS